MTGEWNKVLLEGLRWIWTAAIIPGCLLIFFLLGWQLMLLPAKTMHNQRAKVMGFWLGIAGFMISVTTHIFAGSVIPAVPLRMYQLALINIGIGIGAGLILMALAHSLLGSRAVSVLIAVLVFGSLTSLYFYIFVAELREPVVLYGPTLVAGGILYMMLVPSAFDDLVKGARLREPRA